MIKQELPSAAQEVLIKDTNFVNHRKNSKYGDFSLIPHHPNPSRKDIFKRVITRGLGTTIVCSGGGFFLGHEYNHPVIGLGLGAATAAGLIIYDTISTKNENKLLNSPVNKSQS